MKNKVRRLWARSRANKDNASGQGSEVNNERKSCTAVKSVTATKRTDLKAAQTLAVRAQNPQQKQKNTQLEKTQDLHRAFKMRKQSDYSGLTHVRPIRDKVDNETEISYNGKKWSETGGRREVQNETGREDETT